MRGPNRRSIVWAGALIGGLTSLPLIALCYLGNQVAGLPFIPFDLFEWLTRILPGQLVIRSIETMVRGILFLNLGSISSTAKLIEEGIGIVLFIGACAVAGAFLGWLANYRRWAGWQAGLAGGVLLLLAFTALEMGLNGATGMPVSWWPVVLILGWSTVVGLLLDALYRREGPVEVAAASSALAASGTPPAPEPGLTEGSAAPSTAMADETAAGSPGASGAASGSKQTIGRRDFLLRVAGGAAGLTVVAGGLGYLVGEQRQGVAAAGLASGAQPANGPLPTPESTAAPGSLAAGAVATPAPAAEAAAGGTPAAGGAAPRNLIAPAPGTRPELTNNDDFYRIDIDLLPPSIDESSWFVEVKGLFDKPRRLTLADLKAFPAVTQTITLSCISNPVAGDLIGTSNWTGARLSDVLQNLGIRPQAKALYLTAADGFYETVTMADMMDPRTLLVYAMNAQPLPQQHGFPLRIYIPNRYGMKQPKWITSMEAVDHESNGYWVDRGWSATAHPQIVSVIDTVAKDKVENGKVPVGGIAWAGDRGIRKVEVQVDQGPWTEAELRTPPLSGLTWIQWRYDWPRVPGDHTFRVRATDGTGKLQISQVADTYPDGATGYHSVSVKI